MIHGTMIGCPICQGMSDEEASRVEDQIKSGELVVV